MGPEHLAAIALRTGRTKDLLRLDAFLKMEHEFKIAQFDTLIKQFELEDKWSAFQTKFLSST